jgi:hypothetical protein
MIFTALEVGCVGTAFFLPDGKVAVSSLETGQSGCGMLDRCCRYPRFTVFAEPCVLLRRKISPDREMTGIYP